MASTFSSTSCPPSERNKPRNPAYVSARNRKSSPPACRRPRHGHQRRLRMRPVVRETREVQLRLNIDLDAFILHFLLHRALRHARTLPSVKLDLSDFVIFFCTRSGCPQEGQPGLRIVRPRATAPHAICFQPARNFSPPFGFSGTGSIGIVPA